MESSHDREQQVSEDANETSAVSYDGQPTPTTGRTKRFTTVFSLIVALSAGFLGGWLGAGSHENQPGNSSLVTNANQTVVTSESQAISKIAKNVGQSVVSINATTGSGQSSFTGLLGPGAGSGAATAAGTGIILTADGLIITNRHVIPDDTTDIDVTLSDGTTYTHVKVLGRTANQSSLDIAFLKIQDTKGKKLIPATIGDSSKMAVGNPVVAIGNALGQFQNTVTSGILSGYGRSVQASDTSGAGSENLDNLFQTDAAINQGNSGGPLVDLSGKVIGINTAIASDSQSIGFAIPINDVTGLIKSVETSGKLQQPYIGVIYIPLTSDVMKQYSLKTDRGAWIPPSNIVGQTSVVAGGPADKAGVQEGDIVTAINGTQIDEKTSLTSIIVKQSVGDQVTLTINRDGKTITKKATLDAAPTGSPIN